MSDTRYDLRTLGLVPYDIAPRREHTPEETQRIKDACREDDRRGERQVSEFERRNGFHPSLIGGMASAGLYPYETPNAPATQWADAADAAEGIGQGCFSRIESAGTPPFAESGFLRGLLWGIGLTASVMLVAAVVFLGPLLSAAAWVTGGAK